MYTSTIQNKSIVNERKSKQKQKATAPNQNQIHLFYEQQSQSLTSCCGEGKYEIYFKAPSKNMHLKVKRPVLPDGF